MTIRILARGCAALFAGLALALPALAASGASGGKAPAADPAIARGATLFAQRCAACHALEPGRPSPGGPNLAGVIDRPAASGAFRHSAALRKSGLIWSAQELDLYLAAPSAKVPGTTMFISLRDAGQRAAVIAFLATRPAP